MHKQPTFRPDSLDRVLRLGQSPDITGTSSDWPTSPTQGHCEWAPLAPIGKSVDRSVRSLMKTPCDEGLMASGTSGVPRPAARGAWILAATILGSTMVFIDGTVVNVAVPALQATFHASVVDVQWVVESYGIFLSSLILAGGALGDLFGRRRIFLIGVLIFAAASAACGLAQHSGTDHRALRARVWSSIAGPGQPGNH